jgi:hypothetical protein
MVGMTHSGASPLVSTRRGVFRALIGVFDGVLRADAGADAVGFRGVVGSRVFVLSGNALLR